MRQNERQMKEGNVNRTAMTFSVDTVNVEQEE